MGYAADTNRKAAHIIFDDVDGTTHWYANRKPVEPEVQGEGLIIFDAFYPAAATDPNAKSDLHRRINATAGRILLGENAPDTGLFNWVFVHEIPEGSWGSRGRTIGIRDIASGPQVPVERVAYAGAWLDAERKLRESHSFPEPISSSI